jgi:sugar/nucleoside kinase (ribokinase family)
MRSYVKHLPDAAAEVIDRCDWFFANEEELRALGGDPADADGFRRRAHLTGLVVKAGPKGSSCYTDEGRVDTAAVPVEVVDVTGAGDALAGGMLARWLTTGAEPAGLPDALKHGAACAAIAISDIGVRALKRATPATLAGLVAAASASS